MFEANSNVLAFVERALKEDPSLSSTELQKRAAKVDQSVASLTGRQFHAGYALLAKRRLAGPRRRSSKKRSSKGSKKPLDKTDPVRAVLREQFEQRRAILHEALDDAFERSIEADSLARVNKLLATLDRQIRALEKV